jgi:hydrogenase nickel incorporation protein HypA/HybF
VHELYLTESILKSVIQSLPPATPPGQVCSVTVEAGKLEGVEPDTLIFLFNILKSDFNLPRAQLVVNSIPVVCQCETCRLKFKIEIPLFICPTCESSKVAVIEGRGLILTDINISESE